MRGKVLVFYANAIIFGTLATMGLLLGYYLTSTADCGSNPSATCERTAVTGQTSLLVGTVLALTAVALLAIGLWLHRRERRSG